MKKFKRVDDQTVILEKIIWSTNISKKIFIKSELGYEIDCIVIDGTKYFPAKKV